MDKANSTWALVTLGDSALVFMLRPKMDCVGSRGHLEDPTVDGIFGSRDRQLRPYDRLAVAPSGLKGTVAL